MNRNTRRVRNLRKRLSQANSDIEALLKGGPDADLVRAKYRFKSDIQRMIWFGEARGM